MAFRVAVDRAAWDGFLRRAKKAMPKEYCEAAWGEETVDSFRITSFHKMKLSKVKAHAVEYDSSETKRQKREAHAAGKIFIGTVHTHPGKDYDAAASVDDHRSAAGDEKIMGVVNLYKNDRGRYVITTEWWFPQPKIDFEVV